MSPKRAGIVVCVAAATASGLLLLQAWGRRPRQEEFSKELYVSIMSNRVTDVAGIVAHFEHEQVRWLPLAPPSTNGFLLGEKILPFDAKDFPKEFRRGLIAEEEDLITSYTVYVYEDKASRERVIVNSAGETLATVEAANTDPLWHAVASYPGVDFYDGWTTPHEEWCKAVSDPARIVARFRLMAKKDVIKHVWRASLTPSATPTPKRMYAGQDDPVIDIHFYEIEKMDGGVMVSVVVTNSVTNLDIFVVDNLLGDPFWDLAVNTNLSTNWVEWLDTATADARFYAAGNGSLDPIGDADGDDLPGGREIFMYHTCPTNSDSDGDNYSDYEEVIELNTDPNNNDTNPPTATIVLPTNGTRRVWIP